jgi:hypothetical protein
LRDTRGQYLHWIEDAIPEYRQARLTYAKASEPINQMEVGQTLLGKGASATEDALGNPTLYPEKFARAVQNSEQTAKAALGRNNVGLADVLSPGQMKTVQAIARDLSKKQASEKLAGTINSTTAQNLAGQNLLRQLIGPLGLPQSWLESAILGTIAKPAKVLYGGVAEPQITAQLGRTMLNPQAVRVGLLKMVKPTKLARLDRAAYELARKGLPAVSLGEFLASQGSQ